MRVCFLRAIGVAMSSLGHMIDVGFREPAA